MMNLLERFKTFTTSTPLRTLTSSLTIALLIPVTLFATTQNLEIRRKATTTDSTQEEAYFKFTDFRSPFDGSIGDTFIFKLTDPEKIAHARSTLDGSETELIRPMGIIVKGAVDYNSPWSYHFDPNSVEFFNQSIEVCDSTAQGIEDNFDEYCRSFEPGMCEWCPWGSEMLEEVTPVRFATGWNAWSLALNPKQPTKAQDILDLVNNQEGNVGEIARWDSGVGNWVSRIDGLPFGNFDIKMGEGYFIKANEPSTWIYEGDRVVQAVPVSLSPGFNFVSFPYLKCETTAKEICQDVNNQGHQITEVSRWESSVGNWVGHPCGLPFGNFNLNPYEPYFIRKNYNAETGDYVINVNCPYE